MCGPLSKTLALCMAKICGIPYLKYFCPWAIVSWSKIRHKQQWQTHWTCTFSLTWRFVCTLHTFSKLTVEIHRMQIWRTARSAPGTSRMKARLVRHWYFVLTMPFQKSLASLSIWSRGSSSLRILVFLNAIATYWNLPQQRKCYIFSFLVRLWGETKETEARSSRLPKELLKQVKVRVEIDLRKCVSDRI